MNIIKADVSHVEQIARLFDLYRQFYECEADLPAATSYIRERLTRGESDVFLALDGDQALGFVQLYPSFCSVELMKIYILYDLYVDASKRKGGVGEQLMNTATRFATENGARRLDLLTEHSNHIGQHLYEKLGYVKTNEDFYAYSLYV